MDLPFGKLLGALNILLKWARVRFGVQFTEYPRFQTHADRPFSMSQLESLASHINDEYGGHYERYTVSKILTWLTVCPEIYQVVFDKVLFRERVVGSCKVLPLSSRAVEKIFAGTFESINAGPEDLESSISAASGVWIGDLIVAKHYRVLSAGDAVSKSLLFQLRTLVRPYFGKKLVFARTERDDVRQLLINQGFVPFLREGEQLTGLTPFVRLTDSQKNLAFRSPSISPSRRRHSSVT